MILLLLICIIPYTLSGKCPDRVPCRCVGATTICRANILHVDAAQVQSKTTKLILQVGGLHTATAYDVKLWPQLSVMLTLDHAYTCHNGYCFAYVTSNRDNITLKPVHDTVIDTSTTATQTSPGCYIMIIPPHGIPTCSTVISTTDIIREYRRSTMRYVIPVMCIAVLVLMVTLALCLRKLWRRVRHVRDIDQSDNDSAVTLFDMSPIVLNPLPNPLITAIHATPVASRTRAQLAPIASRLRSYKRD